MTQANDLCMTLLERVGAITQMEAHNLSLVWLKEIPIPQIVVCCQRMDAEHISVSISDKTLQKELICNPAFAAYYAKLLPMFPDEPPAEPKPKPVYGTYGRSSRSYLSTTVPAQHSRRTILKERLDELLNACRAHNRDLTSYPQERLMAVLELDQLNDDNRPVYLENFSSMGLSDADQQTVISNVQHCLDIPFELSKQQKSLLLEPFATTRYLFMSAPFGKVADLLNNCPALIDIVRLLHERGVHERLTIEHYNGFSQNTAEYCRLLTGLLDRIGTDAVSAFMEHWVQNGCPMYELRTMERRTDEKTGLDWEELLSTDSGYVNQLYGSRFKQIDLANVSTYQESVLIYAIVHNKKHFIRLVDENAKTFLSIPSTSVLFQEKLYQEHFNLNELTVKDLADCTWMSRDKLGAESLYHGRHYTFIELRELYGVSNQCVTLYHMLQSDSQDYRLKILRQVRKRDTLWPDMENVELTTLAANLSVKPLDVWMHTDFDHISGLTAKDTAKMLAHLDELRHLLYCMQTRTDVMIALRCLSNLRQCESIAELKEKLLQTDPDWLALVDHMSLTPEFQEKHQESIFRFLCDNGAYIAETYRKNLSEQQKEAFLRVVKAELMGRFDELKYHKGDLQRELDLPLTARVMDGWRVNSSVAKDGLEAREHDDFISTMLLGEQPQRTCLSYFDGEYKECLLSAFDSNKKILYATLNGRIVGRAFLRLTKGRLAGTDTTEKSLDSGFTFVDLENVHTSSKSDQEEEVTLFLERPYISGVGPVVMQSIKKMLIELAEKKANALGIMLVLSTDYRDNDLSGFAWTQYAIYISKSKAGAQYLDSLGGQATVSSEGSYKTSNFLVKEHGERSS